MTTEEQQPPLQPLAVLQSPLSEADPASLNELFARDPLSLSDQEIDQITAEVMRLESRLKDPDFLAKAPAAVVEKERQKLYTLNEKLEKLKQQTEYRR